MSREEPDFVGDDRLVRVEQRPQLAEHPVAVDRGRVGREERLEIRQPAPPRCRELLGPLLPARCLRLADPAAEPLGQALEEEPRVRRDGDLGRI